MMYFESMSAPWRDRSGRVSPLKALVFAALFVPGLLATWDLYRDLFGGPPVARPLTEAVHTLGLWAMRLLIISLALTPLKQIGRWPQASLLRRMVGVAAFVYTALHLLLYVIDLNFDLIKVGTEIVLRFYLTIGFVALLMLLALAVTSTDGMMRRLGGRGWQRLHRLAYPAAALGLWHYFLQSRGSVSPALWLIGLAVWLLLYRLVLWARDGTLAARWWMVLGSGVLATVTTAALEVVYLHWRVNAPLGRLISAQWMISLGVRPAWIVGGILLAVALLALARQTFWQKRSARPPRLPGAAGRRTGEGRA